MFSTSSAAIRPEYTQFIKEYDELMAHVEPRVRQYIEECGKLEGTKIT